MFAVLTLPVLFFKMTNPAHRSIVVWRVISSRTYELAGPQR